MFVFLAQHFFFLYNFVKYWKKVLSRLWIGFPGVRNLYVDTKNTSLRYLEATLWHIALKWRPFGFCPLAANAQGDI